MATVMFFTCFISPKCLGVWLRYVHLCNGFGCCFCISSSCILSQKSQNTDLDHLIPVSDSRGVNNLSNENKSAAQNFVNINGEEAAVALICVWKPSTSHWTITLRPIVQVASGKWCQSGRETKIRTLKFKSYLDFEEAKLILHINHK